MKAMNMHQPARVNVAAADTALCTADNSMLALNGTRAYAGGGYAQQLGGGAGNYLMLSTLVDGSITLNADAATGLVYMIEEEKMAFDLYNIFAEQTGSIVFDRISDSEQKHMDSLLLVAEKAGIDISTVSTTPGVFANTAIQSLYDTLLVQGSVSLSAAVGVGIAVENTDIADLMSYSADTTIGIVGTIYSYLELGSEHHLAAFTQQAALLV